MTRTEGQGRSEAQPRVHEGRGLGEIGVEKDQQWGEDQSGAEPLGKDQNLEIGQTEMGYHFLNIDYMPHTLPKAGVVDVCASW